MLSGLFLSNISYNYTQWQNLQNVSYDTTAVSTLYLVGRNVVRHDFSGSICVYPLNVLCSNLDGFGIHRRNRSKFSEPRWRIGRGLG